MADLNRMKKDMYRYRRLQMYTVFIRLLFTVFAVVLIVLSIIHCVQNGDVFALILKLAAIVIAYIINVFAYHFAMDRMEARYQDLKKYIEEEEARESVPSSPQDNEHNNDNNV